MIWQLTGGLTFIVPSKKLTHFSGKVVLRESFDEELLNKELASCGVAGSQVRATNPWNYRKKMRRPG